MIDAFGVERSDISKGLRVDLPVDWVDKLTDSRPRQKKLVKAVADQMSHPEYGYDKPVEIAFSRKHNNVIDLNKPSDGLKLRLQNGHHRLAAHKQLGRKKIYTDITLRRQNADSVGDQQRRVPVGTGFGPNKDTVHVSRAKPPTFSRKNVARIVSPKKENNQPLPLVGDEIPSYRYTNNRYTVIKSSIGAGRYMRAIDMPAKIRARQIARLKEGKPQVASVRDQQFIRLRAKPKMMDFDSFTPKSKGTVVDVGRKKHKVLIHSNKRMRYGGDASGVTMPNPRTNTNHIEVPNKRIKTGSEAQTIEHEKTHAQLSPRHIVLHAFKNRNAKLGEEARADAMAALKTGKTRTSSWYPLTNNKRYHEVYTKITGKRAIPIVPPISHRTASPEGRKMFNDEVGRQLNEEFMTRASNVHANRYNRKPNLP